MDTPAQPPVQLPATNERRTWAVRSLSRSTTDRDAARRSEPGILDALAADPSTRLLLIDSRGRVALEARAADTWFADGWSAGAAAPDDGLAPPAATRGPQAQRLQARHVESRSTASAPGSSPSPRLAPLTAADLDVTGLSTYYLGRDSTEPQACSWLAVLIPSEEPTAQDAEGAARAHPALDAVLERYPLAALRVVGAHLDSHDAGLASAAAALAAWHGRARFCPACASPTHVVEAGWARACHGCGSQQFPRTDPAVIVAATDDADRLLMVHGSAWEPRRYSVVAGFVEAGESVEAAVTREIAEETGLEAGAVEFVASQPWPFPRSLMLAFRARLASGEHRPRPDGDEVADAVLLSREELRTAVHDGEVMLPGPTSIGRMLIEDWYGGPIG